MNLSYNELKEWLWNNSYRYFIEFVEWQEDRYPNLIANLKIYPDKSIRLIMRDKDTYKWHSEANISPKVFKEQI